jgi:hypothetical protein
MGKYDPLHRYIRRQKAQIFEMSFAEIERIVGAMLPKSAERPQWWANEVSAASAHVQCAAWLEAGVEAFLMIGQDRVQFRRRIAGHH